MTLALADSIGSSSEKLRLPRMGAFSFARAPPCGHDCLSFVALTVGILSKPGE